MVDVELLAAAVEPWSSAEPRNTRANCHTQQGLRRQLWQHGTHSKDSEDSCGNMAHTARTQKTAVATWHTQQGLRRQLWQHGTHSKDSEDSCGNMAHTARTQKTAVATWHTQQGLRRQLWQHGTHSKDSEDSSGNMAHTARTQKTAVATWHTQQELNNVYVVKYSLKMGVTLACAWINVYYQIYWTHVQCGLDTCWSGNFWTGKMLSCL